MHIEQIALATPNLQEDCRLVFNAYSQCRGLVIEEARDVEAYWVDPRYLSPTEGSAFLPDEPGLAHSESKGWHYPDLDAPYIPDRQHEDWDDYHDEGLEYPTLPHPDWVDEFGCITPPRGAIYIEQYTDGEDMPPICVDAGWNIVNGHHRAYSARCAQVPVVLVLRAVKLHGKRAFWEGGWTPCSRPEGEWEGFEGDSSVPFYTDGFNDTYGEDECDIKYSSPEFIGDTTVSLGKPPVLELWLAAS
jgi:hypothetical protein